MLWDGMADLQTLAPEDPPARSASGRLIPLPRAERRRHLLDTARRMVREGGIGALTMAGLAERSGASKPVVYEHFTNAEDVAVALLREYFHSMIDMVDGRTRDAETLAEYLSIAVDCNFELHRADGLPVRALTNGHTTGERLNSAYRDLREGSLDTFADLLGQQGVSPEVARPAGFALWEMLGSMVQEYATGPDWEVARETLKRMMLGAVQALVPENRSRPRTPESILATSQRLKQGE